MKTIKGRFLTICDILFFVLVSTGMWFRDTLVDLLPMYGVYGILILIGFLFIYLFVSSIKGKKNILGIILLVLLIPIVIFLPFREVNAHYDVYNYRQARINIIERIEERDLLADENLLVELPNDYTYLSASGEVTVYLNENDSLVIGFWVYREDDGESIEVIYSNNGREAINESINMRTITSIDFITKNWYYVITNK